MLRTCCINDLQHKRTGGGGGGGGVGGEQP